MPANPPMVQPGAGAVPVAQWEPITPNIQITTSHLFAYGTVVPLAGSEWHATTTGTTTRTVPPWAIVLCIIFFLACFLGLLFLAVKEEKFRGEVNVTVRDAAGKSWSESVPVNDVAARHLVMRRVGWAQTMTSHAGLAGQ